jgi:hypothetical protein
MNKPSSTITAAALAGMAMTVFWGIIATFTTVNADPTLVSGSVTLAASLVGYFKKENVIGKV